jgi:hypothetical protein
MNEDFNYNPKFGGGSDIYLKLNDWNEKEQTVKLRIVSPTYTRIEFRKDDEMIDSKNWDISDIKQAIDDPDIKKSQKFAWVVLVRNDNGTSEAKVWEAGTGVWKKIQSIANDEDWSPISEVDLKVIRRGIKKDARYDIVPSPANRGPITEDEFNIGDEVQLTKYLPQSMPLAKFRETFGE